MRTSAIKCPPQKMPPVVDKIVCGDNCDVMGRFPNECVDLVVTSPPYDDLREYGGHAWDFYGVAWQLTRTLKPGGVVVWVVADATKNGGETGTSMKQALHFQKLGLNIHDTMIWTKPNPIPKTHNRYEQAWEYVFVFSKGKPNTWTPKMVPCKMAGRVRGGHGYPCGHGKRTQKNKGGLYADKKQDSNVWEFPGESKTTHPAPFPEQLAADHIKSWSNEGDLVLDPFNGSGTTTKMACLLRRRYIGIEVNPEYANIAVKRIGEKGFFV